MGGFHINIFYSEEDGGYIADIPDLEACSAFGATADGGASRLEAAQAEGKLISPPRYRPVIYQAVPAA